MKPNEVNYKEREIDILDKLNNGYTREEIYAEYGYVSWRSLDGFMRRKGYIYKDGTYQKPEEMREKMLKNLNSEIPYKASLIAREFEEKGEMIDPVHVAKKFGFSDCGEMNQYMRESGLYYKSASQKYETKLQNEKVSERTDRNVSKRNVEKEQAAMQQLSAQMSVASDDKDLMQYIPLLNYLSGHKEQLIDLLNVASVEQIPRYLVPGTPKVKSIYISDLLIQILDDFARSKNVTIKEICEGAIIQYLSKYGYKSEVEMLLEQKV